MRPVTYPGSVVSRRVRACQSVARRRCLRPGVRPFGPHQLRSTTRFGRSAAVRLVRTTAPLGGRMRLPDPVAARHESVVGRGVWQSAVHAFEAYPHRGADRDTPAQADTLGFRVRQRHAAEQRQDALVTPSGAEAIADPDSPHGDDRRRIPRLRRTGKGQGGRRPQESSRRLGCSRSSVAGRMQRYLETPTRPAMSGVRRSVGAAVDRGSTMSSTQNGSDDRYGKRNSADRPPPRIDRGTSKRDRLSEKPVPSAFVGASFGVQTQ